MGMCITVCLLGLWVILFAGRGKAVQSRMIDDGKRSLTNCVVVQLKEVWLSE